MQSSITVKGQATIPKAIRDHLHLKPGDKVRFFIHPNGSVVLLPTLPVTALRGMLKAKRPGKSLADMNEGIARGATAGAPRPRRR